MPLQCRIKNKSKKKDCLLFGGNLQQGLLIPLQHSSLPTPHCINLRTNFSKCDAIHPFDLLNKPFSVIYHEKRTIFKLIIPPLAAQCKRGGWRWRASWAAAPKRACQLPPCPTGSAICGEQRAWVLRLELHLELLDYTTTWASCPLSDQQCNLWGAESLRRLEDFNQVDNWVWLWQANVSAKCLNWRKLVSSLGENLHKTEEFELSSWVKYCGQNPWLHSLLGSVDVGLLSATTWALPLVLACWVSGHQLRARVGWPATPSSLNQQQSDLESASI